VPAIAQDGGLNPGDGVVTGFSGVRDDVAADGSARKVIDIEGVVARVIRLANPGTPPNGAHWFNEPQSMHVTAAEAGQVFGIAIDDGVPPRIYIAASAVFGLHVNADRSDWMPGMWGPGGGPGTIYVLTAENGYKPQIFTEVMLDGRANTGASLGNIAYDAASKQLFVSDLETGMIHRISTEDGRDLGRYDHGAEGRAGFTDAATGQPTSFAPVTFDPSSGPRTNDCPGGAFENDPSCWNVADFRRRVWGLGVHRDSATGRSRLYYATWGSASFGNPDWDATPAEQQNYIWSIGLTADGDFDRSDVRRELAVPGFFAELDDYKRAGASNPVSDIAFSSTGEMLLAERGGLRNQGLGVDDAFAFPHESRVLRYRRDDQGIWQPTGRNDVGFYDRQNEGKPFMRAGSAGGVSFGPGYDASGNIDPSAADGFIWMSGDALCSSEGPCMNPGSGQQDDPSEVHGLQGQPSDASAELAPAQAYQDYPNPGPATPPQGPDRAYMIDIDENMNADGTLNQDELRRNDSSTVGDVEVYSGSGAPAPGHLPPGSVHLPIGSFPVVPPVEPPEVSVQTMSKIWNAAMNSSTSTMAIEARMLGSVTCRRRLRTLAPSTLAAS